MSPAEAKLIVGHLHRLPVLAIDGLLAGRAMETSGRYGIAYRDGLVIAAAEHGQCTRILSVDLSHGHVAQGVTVTNPFGEAGLEEVMRLQLE